MSLVKCPDCGSEVSNKAKVCPSCGGQLKIAMGKEWGTLSFNEKLLVHVVLIVMSLLTCWGLIFFIDLITSDTGFIWHLVQKVYWWLFWGGALSIWLAGLNALSNGEMNG